MTIDATNGPVNWPNPGTQLFVGFAGFDNKITKFHMDTWHECSAAYSDRGVMCYMCLPISIGQNTIKQDENVYLCFNSQDAYDRFGSWLSLYSGRFANDLIIKYLPEPPDGRISGYMISHNISNADHSLTTVHPTQFFNDWVWIVLHTSGKVYWTSSHWIFENDDDAVLYKLSTK